MTATEGSLRLDKWLWFARVTKTRTLARKLVEAGKVRINREKTTNAARLVRIGDVLTITRERDILVYEINALGERRGPYQEARQFYDDRSPPPPDKTSEPNVRAGPKPDKRERRQLARISAKNHWAD